MVPISHPALIELAALGYSDLSLLRETDNFAIYRGITHENEPVLIKIPNSDKPPASVLRQLEQEFIVARELNRERAVRPLKIERGAGQTALILEECSYTPLSELLGAALEIETFLQIAIGTAAALAEIHNHGLVHKDIKPANIIFDGASGVRITGFGLAAKLSRTRHSTKSPDKIVGTPAYMAPEQTGRMEGDIDIRSDLYSLGVTFYEMLTGQLPFTAYDPMEWMSLHIALPAKPPREHRKRIPETLSDLVMKLLAKSAEDRYQSAEGLQADLEQCAAEWQARGSISPFPLGERDTGGHLLTPAKTYGRELEVEMLRAAFDRVAGGGKPELVLVAGYSGVGKSTVVEELRSSLDPSRVLFVGAKFDQYNRDTPYAALAQVLKKLIRQVLGKSEEDIQEWRVRIQEVVGLHGRLITDLVPDLVALIGEQPLAQEVSLEDARARFNTVFRCLLQIFARPECPLVLYLDDLQWIDAATPQLLEHMLTHPSVKNLLLLGAYRDNEVDPTHPLLLALDSMHNEGATIQTIPLGPLTKEDVFQLTADTLNCKKRTAEPLARLVYEKTAGNPFFTIQFLTALAEQGMVVFDRQEERWQCDLERIRGTGFTDNVVDLMISKLGRLQAHTQEYLKQLACLGSEAKLATLARIQEVSEAEVKTGLLEAMQAGFLFLREDTVSFLHDRVQEAAYALIPESERPKAHISIGRKLLSQTDPERLDDILFDLLSHLNRGVDLIEDAEERTRIAELNASAGRRARASVAYAAAREFFAAAAGILPEGTWDDRYDYEFALHLDWAEVEYLYGAFEQAECLFSTLLNKAKSDLDRVRVHMLRMTLYPIAGKYDDALTAGIEALRLLGETVPEDDEAINRAIAAEAAAVEENLRGRSFAELVEAPLVTDPREETMIKLLTGIGGPAYIGNRPQLYPLFAYMNINKVLQYGVTEEACHAFSGYAILQAISLGDLNTAYGFSRAALSLSERFGDLGTTGSILYLHGNHTNFWLKPFATDFPILEQGFRACQSAGNLAFANYIAYSLVWQAIERGDALEDVLNFSRKYAAFAVDSGNEAIHQSIVLEQQFLKCLMGRTDGELSFSEEGVNELVSVAAIEEGAFTCGVTYYHTMKMLAAYLMGNDAAAQSHGKLAWELHSAVVSQPMQAMFYFLHALILIRLYGNVVEEEQEGILGTLAEYLEKLAFWANSCPENFACKHALVAAEIAAIEGDQLSAERLFERAIETAGSSGFSHWEAMANEAAARFYANRGLETASRAYLREARYGYERWGANTKVRQLDALHPWLSAQPTADRGAISVCAEDLDVMALLKAQHAISSETVPEQLAETLLRIVMEAAGAQNGYLFVAPDSQLFAVVSTAGEIKFHPAPLPAFPGIPESILNYVRRTGEAVLVADASTDAGDFARDQYLLKAQPKSILCLPILRQAEILGLLYLENNLAAGAFTPDHRAVLETLASQAAISLEIAQTYRALQESETKFRSLVQQVQAAVVVHGADTQILASNTMAQKLLGLNEAQLQGKTAIDPAWSFLRDDGSPMPPEEYPVRRVLLEQRALQNLVVGIHRPDRESDVWVLVSAVPVFGEAEEITQVIVSFTDITERRETEQRLTASEQLFRTMVENSPDHIARYDTHLRRVYLNPALRQQFKIPAEKAIGETSLVSSPLTDPVRYMANIRRVIDTGQEYSDETSYRTPEDEIRWASTRFAPEFGIDGKVESVLVISNDTTEQKFAEQERLEYLGFLENLDRINRVLQEEGDVEEILSRTLDAVLDIFDCDRAYLQYPCDPDATAEWCVPMERWKPDYPSPFRPGECMPFHPHIADTLRALLESDTPVRLGLGSDRPIPPEISENLGIRSLLAVAIYPKVDRPWQFGIHQCSHERIWTEQEERLLAEIGRRLSDRLNSLLVTRNLRQSEERYRQFFDNSPLPIREEDFSAVKAYLEELRPEYGDDLAGYLTAHPEVLEECARLVRVLDINQTALVFHEAGGKEVILEELSRIFVPESMADFLSVVVMLMRGETSFQLETELQTLTGRRQYISAYFSVSPGYEQSLGKVLVSLVDITERRQSENRLRLAASVFASSQEGILISDADNCIIDVNPAFTRLTGYTRNEALGQNPHFLSAGRQSDEFYADMWRTINTRGEWQGEIWNRRKSGEVYAEMLSIVAVKDERQRLLHYVGAFTDISVLKEHEAELDHIAHYDMLTAVPNRRLLSDRLNQAIARARRVGKRLAVCYLDLDGFKPINDQFGHEGGDLMLVEIARRLESVLRTDDTVARLGGDEFVLLWNSISDEADCVQALDRVLAQISEPMILEGEPVTVSASIGVTLYPDDDVDADSLLRHADHAMYSAKQLGKNRYQMFDARLERQVSARVEFLDKIARALETGQFELFYQPKVNCVTGDVHGVEALLRWNDPVLGLVGPKEFLPLIENDNLALHMGRWVMEQAVRQVRTWDEMGIELPISVNIFPRHLKYRTFAEDLRNAIETCWPQMPRNRLLLEIVESSDLEELDPIEEVINDCLQMGVGFSLDDFGTGYSSLVYLRRLSIEELKIDQSFVRDMLEDPDDEAIVIGVIGLGQAFGLRVVAEGVETERHAQHLVKLGCKIVQGYGQGRPMQAQTLLEWYKSFIAKGVKQCR
jgi:diguanylate cyclase (GGDEF)-like protein/PAS domain S-box-containing protein